ncbi:hypothetical protein P153DRAFT_208382 [Dothidotthia symphoricarpi CBS 119687]|uniref:Uncharacterized protein n=1 Tax=Dothidotthia symphoricarpi CBS 119687 TaxID=1392245 RepID=A0A6A6AIC7_9PLEO|nr:uncharacterized protein P153DRAFT_208382 [Dothidotthia symphoricarpi CBS 119687]KAF2130993.1 hypothetical protein P153DRAFT_208382 [Dothidotthia symphoricarpi CBS 119687]
MFFQSNALAVIDKPAPPERSQSSYTAEAEPSKPEQPICSVEMADPSPPIDPTIEPPPEPSVQQPEQPLAPSPPPEVQEEQRVEVLDEDQIRALFAGAPRFSITRLENHPTITASYPWDSDATARVVSDSVKPVKPAFLAATMHRHLDNAQQTAQKEQMHQGYEIDVVEMPNMLSAQGLEPGSVGSSHFLELPMADVLISDLQQSRSSLELGTTKNMEIMQTNPERIGIRPVETSLIYDRLIEFCDLYKGLQESAEQRMSFRSSTGDLYANLFSKFLTPPGYDGSTDDPTGLQVQIVTLFKILKLEDVWYDFSLVEWRIKLGQVLWSEPVEHESPPMWTERDILLLQITLACELLLRLDALASADIEDMKHQSGVDHRSMQDFLDLKTKKIDWDLVLARRFLDNIRVVMSDDDDTPAPVSKARALLNMWNGSTPEEPRKPDIILLPIHQESQLSGLLHFAKTIEWPDIDRLQGDLTRKLGLFHNSAQSGQPVSPDGRFFDATTPSSISIYGTPLQTPRSTDVHDGYFGRVGKHTLNRNNSRSLRMPLSVGPTLSPQLESLGGDPDAVLDNVGGWLSRSFLTGLILPGEAISHFLISTLLENDKLAIAALGDSANLYGGFVYANRTWWSKSSIVGRVLACVEGAVECMGWISFQRLPEGSADGWIAIHSEQLPLSHSIRITAEEDVVAQDSAIIPDDDRDSLKSKDLTLPYDLDTLPNPSITFTRWELTPLNSDLLDVDVTPGLSIESDVHVPSLIFTAHSQEINHTLTLAYDIQFITSWPCRPPASATAPAPAPVLRHVPTRSITDTVSRTSSKRSEITRLSRRSSHGFEPLLSHPPGSPDIAPQRTYTEGEQDVPSTKPIPMNAHPLHTAYKYELMPAIDVLDSEFVPPFPMTGSNSSDKKAVLVLDARDSTDMQLLARAWCAEKGLHALIGRVERTCLACCIREARGLGVNVVIRV